MPTSGDVVELDLGVPTGRETGFRHPAVIVTAQIALDQNPAVVQVVPLTSTIRNVASEVHITVDEDNGLDHASAAQCQHIRAVSSRRIDRVRGNVGPVALAEIRGVLGPSLLNISLLRPLSGPPALPFRRRRMSEGFAAEVASTLSHAARITGPDDPAARVARLLDAVHGDATCFFRRLLEWRAGDLGDRDDAPVGSAHFRR